MKLKKDTLNNIKLNPLKLNKKGLSLPIEIIIIFVILIVAAAFVIIFFKGGIEKGGDFFSGQIDSLGDLDDDLTANMYDKCPCTPAGETEENALKGCPQGMTEAQAKAERERLEKDKKC